MQTYLPHLFNLVKPSKKLQRLKFIATVAHSVSLEGETINTIGLDLRNGTKDLRTRDTKF